MPRQLPQTPSLCLLMLLPPEVALCSPLSPATAPRCSWPWSSPPVVGKRSWKLHRAGQGLEGAVSAGGTHGVAHLAHPAHDLLTLLGRPARSGFSSTAVPTSVVQPRGPSCRGHSAQLFARGLSSALDLWQAMHRLTCYGAVLCGAQLLLQPLHGVSRGCSEHLPLQCGSSCHYVQLLPDLCPASADGTGSSEAVAGLTSLLLPGLCCALPFPAQLGALFIKAFIRRPSPLRPGSGTSGHLAHVSEHCPQRACSHQGWITPHPGHA